MTQLKNSDRDVVLEKVLKESFEPRFQAIFKNVEALARADVADRYPAFVRGWADTDLRPYMRSDIFDGSDVKFDANVIAKPIFGKRSAMPETRYYDCGDNYGRPSFSGDLRTPNPYNIVITNVELIAEYRNAWADYCEAFSTMRDLVYGYTNREKFETDFPQFAKYLPTRTIKAGELVVQVDDVLAKLKTFGVPAK